MAIYRTGQASMDADGIVTGYGTKWRTALSLIRAGATILFISEASISIAVISEIISDTQIKAITTDGKAVARTDYAILLHDSITVDGLAQDVAETLRYYQGKETQIAKIIDIIGDFDWDRLEQLLNDVKAQAAAAKESQTNAAASATGASASKEAAESAKTATEGLRDQAAQSVKAAQAAQSAAEGAKAAAAASSDTAKGWADSAEEWAKNLNADELMRKDKNLSDVVDKAQALKNLQNGKPLTLVADAIGQYDAVTLKQLQAFNTAGTNFNVITSDSALPANGTVVRGGAVQSVYRAAGKTHASAAFQVKDTIGGSVIPELTAINSTGQVTSWSMPTVGGELVTINQLGTAATENKQTSTTDTNGLLINGAWGLGGGAIGLGGWSDLARQQRSSFVSSTSDSPVSQTLFMGVNVSHGIDAGYAAQFAARNKLGFYWRTRENAEFNPWIKVYDENNTTRASDGTLKAASPVARIVKSKDETKRSDVCESGFTWCGTGTCNDEALGITISRLDVGVYTVTGSLGLAKEGWRLLPPRDPEGGTDLGIVEAEETESGGITVRLYKRRYMLSDEGEIELVKGSLIDVPENSWIDIRLSMPEKEVQQDPSFDE